jgi:hypothetical protein
MRGVPSNSLAPQHSQRPRALVSTRTFTEPMIRLRWRERWPKPQASEKKTSHLLTPLLAEPVQPLAAQLQQRVAAELAVEAVAIPPASPLSTTIKEGVRYFEAAGIPLICLEMVSTISVKLGILSSSRPAGGTGRSLRVGR